MTTNRKKQRDVAAPRVSVVMIFFNGADYMAEAIDSVLAQTMTDFELLLVDDGSTDGSAAIAQAYADRHPAQLRCIHHRGQANRGACAARNLGLRAAQSEFVAFIDCDDRWRPAKLAEQLAVFDCHPKVDAVFGAITYWRGWAGGADVLVPTGHVQDCPIAPHEALLWVYPLGSAAAPCPSDMMIRRDAAVALGGFEESFTGSLQMYEDQAFFAKLYLDCTVYFDARNWLDYRVHDASCSAMVLRDGGYAGVRSHFLGWLETYLEQRPGGRTPAVRKALASARFRSRHPWIGRAAAFVGWR